MNSIRCTAEGVLLTIRVVPRASQNKVMEIKEEYIKVAVKSPPVENKANETLVEFLAKKLAVPKSALQIKCGRTGKNKIVEIKSAAPKAFSEGIREKLFL
jgi:uncharacterized protein